MTTRTKYLIVCDCGHKGYINMSENDQPYSKPYEQYSLENLNGSESSFYTKGFAKLEEVFQKLEPTCPKCDKLLSLEKHLNQKK